jgi:hypothetical protein
MINLPSAFAVNGDQTWNAAIDTVSKFRIFPTDEYVLLGQSDSVLPLRMVRIINTAAVLDGPDMKEAFS